MSPATDRVEQVRRVIAAGGGWNRRSRAALLAWARAEGLDDGQLRTLLERALGMRLAAPSSGAARPDSVTPTPVAQGGVRWWLAVASVAGLAASALLVAQLARLAPRERETTPRSHQAAVVDSPDAQRTLPPPPVPFAKPPSLEPPAGLVASMDPQSIGDRPVGELSRLDLKRFVDAWRVAAVGWVSMGPLARAAALRQLSPWVAGSVSAGEARRIAQARTEAGNALEGTRDRMLADAFDVMLDAEVARDPALSSWAAETLRAGGSLTPDAALQAWLMARLPTLAAEYAAPQARERWATWLQSACALSDAKVRTGCLLEALGAILQSKADIGRPGVATDAAGSLVAGLPTQPQDPAVAQVRDAWATWLSNASIPSARLWALGGVWRSRDPSIDVTLLPGERDAMPARSALAAAWKRIRTAAPAAWWQGLQAERARPVPGALEDPRTRVQDLTSRVRLVRLLSQEGRPETARSISVAASGVPEADAGAARWSQGLLDRTPEARVRTLRVMQGASPRSIAPADAEALAMRALSGPTSDEITLAQDVVRGSLRQSTAMRTALAHELAVASDPRRHADFLQDMVGGVLPSDDSDATRAAAIAALLGQRDAVDAAAADLADELSSLERAAPSRGAADAGEAAWLLAARAARLAEELRVAESMRPLATDLTARVRRLRERSPDGPRGLSAALSVMVDAEAARLSVIRPQDADAARLVADGAARARSTAPDALTQAAISLDALADLRLLGTGEASVAIPAAQLQLVRDPAQAVRALAEADRALAPSTINLVAARAALRAALAADPATAPSVALAMAQSCAEGDQRDRWLDAARLMGAGAALPRDREARRRHGLAAAQLLSWGCRAQSDRLSPSRLTETLGQELDRVARGCGISNEACVRALREPGDPARNDVLRALRSRAAWLLADQGASWSDAIAGGGADPVPEADPAQPWRLSLPAD